MKKNYLSEIEGMVEFFQELQIVPSYDLNTDGVINATLFEFKKTKSVDGGVSKHKEQLKRYLKAYNSAAKNIPSISYLIYLNSFEYIKIDNENGQVIEEGNWVNALHFKDDVQNNHKYLKGYIDEFSIVSYNNRFCSEISKNASKREVKNEFINPQKLHIEPFDWDGQLNKEKNKIGWLHFNMNLLGNELLKKQLGAFFTPEEYVKISTKYVRDAIKRSKEKGFDDYLIIDRCAGTGNLERLFSNEELSHVVLNTYDYTEWTTLNGLYKDRVRLIIPPTNEHMTGDGLLSDGNALTESFNDYLTSFLSKYNREKTYIIFLENPPFRDETSTLSHRDSKSRKNKTYIDELMNNDNKIKGAMKNELSIKFIWSAWKIYEPDEYILYSPIKYWKKDHIFDKKYYSGYITDKKEYNANYNAGLPIINWSKDDVENEVLKLENGEIYKIFNSIKTLLDKEKNEDWIAKMYIQAGEIRPIGTSLDNGKQVVNDTPALLNEGNILNQLPLWAAAKYETKDLELNILMKCGDGLGDYKKDNLFKKSSFIWSVLTNKNKCISDEERLNNFTFLQNTRCDVILNSLNINNEDKKLLERWKKILEFVKGTEEYKSEYNYGLSQIEKEINVQVWNGSFNKKQDKIFEYKYPELRDQIGYLKKELKNYYSKNIEPKVFKYQLIK